MTLTHIKSVKIVFDFQNRAKSGLTSGVGLGRHKLVWLRYFVKERLLPASYLNIVQRRASIAGANA